MLPHAVFIFSSFFISATEPARLLPLHENARSRSLTSRCNRPRRGEDEAQTLSFSFPQAGLDEGICPLEALLLVWANRRVIRAGAEHQGMEVPHWPEPARQAIGHLAAHRKVTLLQALCPVHPPLRLNPLPTGPEEPVPAAGGLLRALFGKSMTHNASVSPYA
jgi:hypothetical protein